MSTTISPGDRVRIHYTSRTLEGGVIETSDHRGAFEFRVGSDEVSAGPESRAGGPESRRCQHHHRASGAGVRST